jgi:PAS domain S-box-containing protein
MRFGRSQLRSLPLWLAAAAIAYLLIQLIYLSEQRRAGLLGSQDDLGDIFLNTFTVHALSFGAWLVLAALGFILAQRGLGVVSRSLEAERQRTGELALISEIGAALVEPLSPEAIALAFLQRARRAVSPGATAAVILYDQPTETCRVIAADGPRAADFTCTAYPLEVLPPPLRARLMRQRLPFLLPDTATGDETWRELSAALPQLADSRALCMVPLVSRDRLVGAVLVRAEQPGALDTSDLQRLTLLVRYAAGALHNALLQANRQRQLTQVQELNRLTGLISSSLNTRQVLSEIARAAVALTDAAVASFWVVDEGQQSLDLWAFSDEQIGASQTFRRARFGEGASGWVAQHREALVVDDVFEDGRSGGLDWWREHGLRSSCTLPVLLGDTLLAVLSINGREPFRFRPGDWDLLQSFVAQGATAIANARLYEQLEHALRQNESILNSAGEGIFGIDRDGLTIFINPAASTMLGYQPEEIVGRSPHSIVHHSAPDGSSIEPDVCRIIAAVTQGKKQQVTDEHFWRKDGSSFPVEYTSTPIVEAGLIRGAVIIFDDCTERRRAETEIAEALESQRAANLQLERLHRAKSDFVSIVSHEFRTPLTSIQGLSELMRDEPFSVDEMRDFAADIHREALRLARLIAELLDLDRMESGLMQLNRGTVDLAQVAVDVAAQLAPSAPQHHIAVQTDGVATTLDADHDKLVQVVTNLLANAIKYSPAGGEISVRLRGAGHTVVLEVEDQGLGIPAEALETIFERYIRVESGPARHIQGTGLGLPIVRQIVEMHGGRVLVESVPGRGSIFRVLLPRRSSRGNDPDAQPAEQPALTIGEPLG